MKLLFCRLQHPRMKGFLITTMGLCLLLGLTEACNEAICASLVSKCLLIESCSCDMSDKANCKCCGECQLCLAKLYSECCSCVGKLRGSLLLAHLSRRLTGELIVYPCSGVRRRPSSSTISKIFSSETTWPIKAKLHVEHP